MNIKDILLIIFLTFSIPALSQNFDLDRDWGTYFGDERFSLQGSEKDQNGNLYITGYVLGGIYVYIDMETGEPTSTSDFGNINNDFTYFDNSPHQSIHGGGGADGFIAKFNPLGELLWATFLGGEEFDVIEGITIDRNGNVYVLGATTSLTGIATPNATQTEKAGFADLFLAKFNPDGDIIWSTYYGDTNLSNTTYFPIISNSNFTSLDTDGNYIVHDKANNLYITSSMGYANNLPITVAPYGDIGSTSYIAKFTDNGEFVWSTLYGINASEITGLCFCDNNLYVSGNILTLPTSPYPTNNTYYGSTGAYQPVAGNVSDTFIAKFNENGERVWGTYYGKTGADIMPGGSNISIACNNKEDIYYAMQTTSDNMATMGAYQETRTSMPVLLTKFSDIEEQTDPARIWATYYGLQNNSTSGNPSYAVAISDNNFIYLSGANGFTENIASEGAWQEEGGADSTISGFVAKFNANGERIWGTYYNGEAASRLVKALPYGNEDSFYITGITLSNTEMTTENSLQPEREVWNTSGWQGDKYGIFIAHFSSADLSTSSFVHNKISIYPNPVSDILYFDATEDTTIEKVIVFDLSGRKILKQNQANTISVSNLQKGNYILKIFSDKGVQTEKIIVK